MRNNTILFLVLLVCTGVLTFSVLREAAQQSSVADRQNTTEARVAWETQLTSSDQALLCDIYYTETRETVLAQLTQTPTNLDVAEAQTFYDVLNEEC